MTETQLKIIRNDIAFYGLLTAANVQIFGGEKIMGAILLAVSFIPLVHGFCLRKRQ